MLFPSKLAECGVKVPAEDSSDLESGRAVSDENFYELIDSYCQLISAISAIYSCI